MADWAREIMKLGNDFCLNTSKVRNIVSGIDSLSVPEGKCESEWKYDRAYSKVKSLIMTM